jgi:hypothetical protein
MSGLKNPTLLTSPDVSFSGGSTMEIKEDSINVSNGLHLIVTSDPDFQTRRQFTVKTKPPTFDPKTGTYGKDKKSVSFVVPSVDPVSNKLIFNVIRVEREIHPSVDLGVAASMNKMVAQIVTCADFRDFFDFGTLN